jgi:alkylhydroperoxidase family enzyme
MIMTGRPPTVMRTPGAPSMSAGCPARPGAQPSSPGPRRGDRAACVDAGATRATKAGVSPEKLLTLAAWYEDPRFDDAERAALALTEAATRLSDRPGAVTDEIWAEATRHYDERQLEALVLMVAITNFFNRLNTTFRVPAGTSWD